MLQESLMLKRIHILGTLWNSHRLQMKITAVNGHSWRILMGRALYQMKLSILLSVILIVEGCQMDMKILDQGMIHCHLPQSRTQSQNIGEVVLDRNNRVIVVRWKLVLIARRLKGAAVLRGLLSVQIFSQHSYYDFLLLKNTLLFLSSIQACLNDWTESQFLEAYLPNSFDERAYFW
jgi:hypothetical protein